MHLPRTCALLAILVASSLSLVAQEPAPEAAAPLPPPVLRIEIPGPAVLRDILLPTNLGILLAGEEAEPLWERLFARLAGLERHDGSSPGLRELLNGYRGALVVELHGRRIPRALPPVVVQLHPSWTTRGVGVDWEYRATVDLVPDGKTDMAALAAGLQHVCAKEFPGLGMPPIRIAAPPAGTPKTAPPGARPFFTLDLDLQQVAQAIRDDWFSVADLAFGLPTWRHLALRCRAAGPHVRADLTMHFAPGPRGIFDAFLPDVRELPALLAALPEGVETWSVAPWRPDLLFDLAVACFAPAPDRAALKLLLGFDPEAEIADRLGHEFLLLGTTAMPDPSGDGQDGEEGEGYCLVVPCKDAALAAPLLLAKIFDWAAEPARPDEPVENAPGVIQVSDDGRYFARTEDHLFFAYDKKGRALLVAALRPRAAAPDGGARKPDDMVRRLPSPVQRTIANRPDGCNGIAVLHADATRNSIVRQVLTEAWDALARKFGVHDSQPPFTLITELARKYRLRHMVVYTGAGDGVAELRVVW